MSIIKPGEGKRAEQKSKFTNRTKQFSKSFGDFLSWKSYYDDEIGVDTRNQSDRNLQKTWKMYHLEQERKEEVAKSFKEKLEKLLAELLAIFCILTLYFTFYKYW